MDSIPIVGLLPEELAAQLAAKDKKSYVHRQVLQWVYEKAVGQFSEMRNISKSDQRDLDQQYVINPLTLVTKQVAADESAVKYLFKLADGHHIETVVLQEKKYKTVCVSSQCGCGIGCRFCLTGTMGLMRNLTTAEIVGQIQAVRHDGHTVSHVVFMGMGEPLVTVESVVKAIAILTHIDTFQISKRKITVSTSGIINGIRYLIDHHIMLNLAFSVGHPNPTKREVIMPVERHNPIMTVSRLLSQYQKQHNRQLTLEYTLLDNVNDDETAIDELIRLARYLRAKINLINLNPHHKIPYQPVSVDQVNAIATVIKRAGILVSIRYPKGQDIVAACGQLYHG